MRGRGKRIGQSEKLLLVLLSGNEVSVCDVRAALGSELVWERMSVYLSELRAIGAYIRRYRTGRFITSYQLMNPEEMLPYVQKRNLLPPPPIVLSSSDFMIGQN